MAILRSKGNSLLEWVDKYTVIDIETTGLDPSWDSIIEVSGIKYNNGEEVDRFSELLYLEYGVSSFITELTGITSDMLRGARPEKEVLKDFFEFIDDSILVGHNIQFDINFLYDARRRLFGELLQNDFIDTMRVSRLVLPELKHHRLKDIAEYYDISYAGAHRAAVDCEITKLCYEKLKKDVPENFSFKNHKKSQLGLKAKNISSDNQSFDISSPIYGNTFVFTGTLETMTRREAMQAVVDRGGINADSVLGNYDYSNATKDEKSTKHKKAEALKLSGQDIEVISENVFLEMLEDTILDNNNENTDMTVPIQSADNWIVWIEECCKEAELAYKIDSDSGSIFLRSNYGKEKNKKIVTSYSISIYEAEYPKISNTQKNDLGSVSLCNMKEKNGIIELSLGKNADISISHPDFLEKIGKEGDCKYRISIDKISHLESKDLFKQYIFELISFGVEHYRSKATHFGCCGRYIECSNMGKCVHPNVLYSRACEYRANLELGRIFFGKNRNI